MSYFFGQVCLSYGSTGWCFYWIFRLIGFVFLGYFPLPFFFSPQFLLLGELLLFISCQKCHCLWIIFSAERTILAFHETVYFCRLNGQDSWFDWLLLNCISTLALVLLCSYPILRINNSFHLVDCSVRTLSVHKYIYIEREIYSFRLTYVCSLNCSKWFTYCNSQLFWDLFGIQKLDEWRSISWNTPGC